MDSWPSAVFLLILPGKDEYEQQWFVIDWKGFSADWVFDSRTGGHKSKIENLASRGDSIRYPKIHSTEPVLLI